MGSEKRSTPSIRAKSALQRAHEYRRRSIMVEQSAVVRILHCANMVNMPAPMFWSDTKERMFIRP
eukprot:7840663-Ditylum_brightwellii.AAC.1